MQRFLILLACAAMCAETALATRTQEGEACISSFNAADSAVTLLNPYTRDLDKFRINLPTFLPHTLFALIDIVANSAAGYTFYSHDSPAELDATFHATIPANSTTVDTWMATRYRIYSKLSPTLFDALSLGSLSVGERTNASVLLLPVPVCSGKEGVVVRQILRSVSNY